MIHNLFVTSKKKEERKKENKKRRFTTHFQITMTDQNG